MELLRACERLASLRRRRRRRTPALVPVARACTREITSGPGARPPSGRPLPKQYLSMSGLKY